METIVVSRSCEVAADVSAVLGVIGDPHQLPSWAPGFARSVRETESGWVSAHPAGFDLPFELRVDRECGTADVIVSRTPPRGAYLRALAMGAGCHLTLTIIVPTADGVDEAGQHGVAESELQAIRALLG